MARYRERELLVKGRLVDRVVVANTYVARLRGLLGTRKDASPLLLDPANSVHGLGMTYTLDVAQLDDEGVVVRIARLRPFGLVGYKSGVARVLEATAGSFAAWGLEEGDRVVVR